MEPIKKTNSPAAMLRKLLGREVGLSAWIASRRWKCILPALPSILVAAGIFGACVWTRADQSSRQSRYLAALSAAIADEDSDLTVRYVHKLAGLGMNDNPNVRMIHAAADYRAGRQDAANATFAELAPLDKVGFPRAHAFVAERMLAEGNVDVRELPELKHHLAAVTTLPERRTWASSVLAMLYLREKNFDEAIPHLEVVATEQPESWLLLGQTLDQSGQPEAAQRAYRKAVRHFKSLYAKSPKDSDIVVQLSRSYFLAGDFELAEKTLLRALALDKSDKKIRIALASLYTTRVSNEITEIDPKSQDFELGFRLIERALTIAPNHPPALQLLSKYLELGEQAGPAAKERLDAMLARGDGTALLHFVLATHAIKSGDEKRAMFHMARGYKQDPNMPALLNNMAWVASNREPANLDRALSWVERGIELLDKNAPIYFQLIDTRGHILFKLERWDEAIDDLELALPRLNKPSKRTTHETLAKAYREIGEPGIAEAHEREMQAITLQ